MVLGERSQVNASHEKFVGQWNEEFPDVSLTQAALKNTYAVFRALLAVFDRLGFDVEAILAPPPEEERSENVQYYWDLLPIINMTRLLNYLVFITNSYTITIMVFLQPSPNTSHSILLLMFNYLLFIEDRLRQISPYEEELFEKTNQVKALENHKNKLLEQLNEQAEEKGKRAERLEKLNYDLKKLEEELKQEKEIHDVEKQELEAILKENQQLDMLLEQKLAQRDTLLVEVERKRALRVYDADDIKAKAKKAAQNVQEAEEYLNSVGATLKQHDNCIKNLQSVKPNLDVANNLLKEISRGIESLKDCDSGDLEADAKEGELNLLTTELVDIEAYGCEVAAAREELAQQRQQAQAKRLVERATAHSNFRDAEENHRKLKESSKQELELIESIKQETVKYEEEKAKGMEEIVNIKTHFCNEQKIMEDYWTQKALEIEKKLSEKMRNRKI